MYLADLRLAYLAQMRAAQGWCDVAVIVPMVIYFRLFRK